MSNEYSVDDKIRAVRVLQRFGGLTNEGIAAARKLLDAPTLSKSTLYGWQQKFGSTIELSAEPLPELGRNTQKTPEPEQVAAIANQADNDLAQMFEDTAREYLNHARSPEVITDVKGKDAVIAAATAVDKMRILRGLPTEIVQVMPILMDVNRRIAESNLQITLMDLLMSISRQLPSKEIGVGGGDASSVGSGSGKDGLLQ